MKKYVKLCIFLVVVALILVCNHLFGWGKFLSNTQNLQFLVQLTRENVWLSSLIYIALTAVSCVVLALPGITFAVFAGVLFGAWLGTLLCLVATTLGAVAAFLVGRYFLKDALKPVIQKNDHLNKLLFEGTPKSDFFLLMLTRLVPLFPYNLQNFAYGITNIKLLPYTLYTFIFMFPGVAAFTIASAGFANEGKRTLYIIIGVLALVLLSMLGLYLKKVYVTKPKHTIIFFTRVPLPNQTKTRLMPFLTPEECAKLHQCFISDIYTTCQNIGKNIDVFFTPPQEQARLEQLLSPLSTVTPPQYVAQKGNTLGERMQNAFAQVFAQGTRCAILIGSDIPSISETVLNQAFQALQTHDVVINPTQDGGYYLIGMKQNHNIWNIQHYGTNTVLQDTIQAIEEANLTYAVGKTLQDVDTKEDMLALFQNARDKQHFPHTMNYITHHLKYKCHD